MADTSNSNLLAVRLVTPDRLLLDATAEAVELPALTGYIEIASTALHRCLRSWAQARSGLHGGTAGEQIFFVAWGFVEVLPERVTILAETALHPEEIDTAEARAELAEGEKLWATAGDECEKYEHASVVIREAEEKLASASEGRSH